MKQLFLAMALLVAAGSCKRQITREEVVAKLSDSMLKFLYNAIDNDSSKAKYRILETNFYEEKAIYECEFKVRLITPKSDTVGFMQANITKDFSTVRRKS